MNDWNTSSVKGFGEVVSGGTPSTIIDAYWNGSIIWITPADLSKVTQPFITTSSKKITKEGLESSSANIIPAYNIVMSSRAPIGYFAIPTIDFCTNQGCKSIRVDENNDSLFHYYNLTFNVNNILKYGEGTTFAEISKKQLEKVKFNYPSLPQQKKIAKILFTCDTVINQTKQAIKKYEAIKQGMMTDLFTRGIDVITDKLRLSYEAQPDLYKQSESGWIPNDWTTAQLKDYTIKNMYGPRFSANDYDTKGNVRTIRGMDFSKNGNILYKQAPIASLPVSKVSTHLLIEDDVVIVTTADCGLTAVYEEQGFPYIPSAYSVKFRFTKDLNPYFFKYFMQTNFAHRLVNKYVRQGTLGNLPGSDILIFKIIVPHFDEQKRIVEKLDFISYKIRTEQETLKKYQQIKAGLMQDLLTGKVQVQTDDAA